MFYNYDIFFKKIFILLVILLFILLCILILYKKKFTDEHFLPINDSRLYNSDDSDDSDKDNLTPGKIKYQIPVAVNQLNDNQLENIDSNILRNVRVLKTFSMIDELDIYQIYNILKQMKNDIYTFNYDINEIDISKKSKIINSEKIINVNSGAINNVNLELFSRIKMEIISAFNNLIIKKDYYLNYHPYVFFKIINSNLISFNKKENKKENKNENNQVVYNWCMKLTFAREYKYQQFIIYYDLDVEIQNNINYTIIVNSVELEGISIPKTIQFHENQKTESKIPETIKMQLDNLKTKTQTQTQKLNYYNQDQVSDNEIFDVVPNGEKSKLFQKNNIKYIDVTERSDMDLTLFDKDSMSSKINEKIMNISKDQQYNNHKCFGLVNGINKELPQYKNPIFCKSYHPEINQNGIWDAPCQVDNDCPFYNANKNYPNKYGMCDKTSGICEMPLGVIPIGFTKYGKVEPNCYNCNINSKDNKCCGDQMNNIKMGKAKYLSPDYIFNNDENNRKKYKKELENIGLNANPSM